MRSVLILVVIIVLNDSSYSAEHSLGRQSPLINWTGIWVMLRLRVEYVA